MGIIIDISKEILVSAAPLTEVSFFICAGVRKEVCCFAARTPRAGRVEDSPLPDKIGLRKEICCFAARRPRAGQGRRLYRLIFEKEEELL